MPACRATFRRRRHAAIALLLGAATWGGCSVEKHYELLSLFFDGVPDPNATAADGGPGRPRDGRGPGPTTVVSAHAAWTERRCTDCHVPQRRDTVFLSLGVGAPEKDVCMKCHAAVLDAPRHLHGPVAARFCLECHQPHESPLPHLLIEPAPDLCLGCHSFDMLLPVPEHGDVARSCLDCHYGHGGDDPMFLRPAPEPPAAEEATVDGAG